MSATEHDLVERPTSELAVPPSFKFAREMQTTVKDFLTGLPAAIGHLDFEVAGDTVTIRDHGRRVHIDLVYEGQRRLGSLDLPMTRAEFEFVGYTEPEMKVFLEHFDLHARHGGGG